MKFLESLSVLISRWMIGIAGFFLIGMIALTCGNIFLRLTWSPIAGAVELTGYLSAVSAAFSLGYTQIKKGHIAVDVLVNSLPVRLQKITGAINDLFCFLFFLMLSRQAVARTITLRQTGELSETLQITYYPFVVCVAIGCLALSLVFLKDMATRIVFSRRKG